MSRDPFGALGLAASSDLTDDDVRAAWRRIAAATHPDRADGGDPAAFALAAGAYSELRTRFGRTEALADLRTTPRRRPAGPWADRLRPAHPRRTSDRRAGPWADRLRPARPRRTSDRRPSRIRPARPRRTATSWAGRWASPLWRFRPARPARLALRVASAAGVSVLVVVIAGWQPATFALIVGALTWLIRTARHDLAPHSPAARHDLAPHRPATRHGQTTHGQAARRDLAPHHPAARHDQTPQHPRGPAVE